MASQFEIVSQTVSMIDVLLMSNPSLQQQRGERHGMFDSALSSASARSCNRAIVRSRNMAACNRDETGSLRAVVAHISGLEVIHHAPK